ncbi:MAG: PD40 domain-containing protein [Armatimonadetes bacterium]|nr:PD40 domain-containing protein [Armatimonadota bacterium]
MKPLATSAFRCARAILACIRVGAIYGAAAGAAFGCAWVLTRVVVAVFSAPADSLAGGGNDFGPLSDLIPTILLGIPMALFCVLLGCLLGLPSGLLMGLMGGSIGGRAGWVLGGLVGGALSPALLFSLRGKPTLVSALVGGAVGWIVGSALRNERPRLPLLGWLKPIVSESPLEKWPAWTRLVLFLVLPATPVALDVAAWFPRMLRPPGEIIGSLAFSPDGKLLATAGSGGIVLWNPRTGARQRTLTSNNSYIRSIAFSADGRLLAAGSTAQLWDVASGRLLQQFGWAATAVALSPDGKTLASANWVQREVCLWDTESGNL